MSWQNVILSALMRRSFRRADQPSLAPADVRAQAEAWRAYQPKPAAGWRLRTEPSQWSARAIVATGAPAAENLAGKSAEPRGTTPRQPIVLQDDWIEPASAAARALVGPRCILYLHGGGYFFCSPRTHRALTLRLAREACARVFVPAYRLAPEDPCPAALEDALAAYRRLLALGTLPRHIVVAGDSAGGGLALALLQTLAAQGDPMPAAGVLFSPWTDLTGSGASMRTNAHSDVMFSERSVRTCAAYYLGDLPADDPRASPLHGRFDRLPPLLIQASAAEILLDDAVRSADRARAAGVAVTLQIWPKLPHAWQMWAPFLPEANRALRQAGAFIQKQTHNAS